MTNNDVYLYLWHRVRDQIAENVPGFDELTGFDVAELCCALVAYAWAHPNATWKDLDAARDAFLSGGSV